MSCVAAEVSSQEKPQNLRQFSKLAPALVSNIATFKGPPCSKSAVAILTSSRSWPGSSEMPKSEERAAHIPIAIIRDGSKRRIKVSPAK